MAGLYKFDAYPKDWFLDTRDLSPAAKGVYIDLIMAMYANGGPLADEERYLCRVCGCMWRTLRKMLAELVDKDKIKRVDGRIVNGRTCREIEAAQARIEAGRSGGNGKAKSVRTASGLLQNEGRTASGLSQGGTDIEQNQGGNVCPSPSPSPSPSKVRSARVGEPIEGAHPRTAEEERRHRLHVAYATAAIARNDPGRDGRLRIPLLPIDPNGLGNQGTADERIIYAIIDELLAAKDAAE
jgi:uncharacterized protein YdaU (DUF1376 family)